MLSALKRFWGTDKPVSFKIAAWVTAIGAFAAFQFSQKRTGNSFTEKEQLEWNSKIKESSKK